MASVGLVLGLAGGFAVLYYMVNQRSEVLPGTENAKSKTRNVNWVYTDYGQNINNPLNTKNRFSLDGVVTSVTAGINEQDLLSYGQAYETYQIYRLPTVW